MAEEKDIERPEKPLPEPGLSPDLEKTMYDPHTVYDKKPSYGGKSAYADIEHDIRANSVRYSIDRSFDSDVIYKRGRLITIHERKLPTGLLGYTDTNSEIVLSVKDDFGIPKEKVKLHEIIHCLEPDDPELTVRYKTDMEFEPVPGLSQLKNSFYSEPLYETES